MAAEIRRVLGIETSCDDTSAAIVDGAGKVEAVVSANQDLAHAPFGGIVPELASRNHTLNILPLVDACLKKASKDWNEIDGLAVTSRPGLLGSLMVGVVTAKTLALAHNKPFVGVNHIEGHLLAPLLSDDSHQPPLGFAFPYVALVISGGHTHLFEVQDAGKYRLIGRTIDDAAGEAFDKFAKMTGLGYPGGVEVDRRARQGDPKRFHFPRALLGEDDLNFSFSGLKTAALRVVEKMDRDTLRSSIDDLCASYQEAIVEVLVSKLIKAAELCRLNSVAITGGVSANSRLREMCEKEAQSRHWWLAMPPLRYCTDNAAMIGYAGLLRLARGERSNQELGPSASALPGDYLGGDQ